MPSCVIARAESCAASSVRAAGSISPFAEQWNYLAAPVVVPVPVVAPVPVVVPVRRT